jgi:DNA-directed RNA polymerase I and III subunit RPAC1
VLSSTRDELCFELVGADASVANALRRILISEVPTVAIESVRFRDNTSIVQDEVLAHRFGLVPLAVDPRMLEYRKRDENGVPGEPAVGDTVVFDVEVTCRDRRPGDGDA